MQRLSFTWFIAASVISILLPRAGAQIVPGTSAPVQVRGSNVSTSVDPHYTLGPGDQISVSLIGAEELEQGGNFSGKAFQIDNDGYVNVPIVGRIPAAGLTSSQLQAEVVTGLKKYIRDPHAYINVTSLKSQPVSVLGAVNTPGVHQIEGPTTLVEVLAMAGGLAKDAAYDIKITRQVGRGPIPLPTAVPDSTGKYITAEVNVRDLTEAKNPRDNILIYPNDVVTVPRSELVYVIGEVKKAGGFTLGEQKNISVLQALSLAEGLSQTAAPRKAKILRQITGNPNRTEIPINLKKLMAGKSPDMELAANDILFVPDNNTKRAGTKIAETALQTISGVVIWRGL